MPVKNGIVTVPKKGSGRMKGSFFAGPGGNCACPACGAMIPHAKGSPCKQRMCPKCGQLMMRL